VQLTAANLEAGLQQLIFPLGMHYIGPPPPHEVTEDDYGFTGCGELGTSDCAPSVWVQQVGDAFLIGFHGELQGAAAPALQAFDTGSGSASIRLRRDGVEYDGLEVLDITTGSGADVINVRGTGATSHTDVHTGAGDDRIYVSSRADVPLTGPGSRPDYLFGDLSLIGGTLNLDAGTGRHTLLISDEAALVGDDDVVITGDRDKAISRDGRTDADPRLTSAAELADADIYVVGLAGRAITYTAAPTGTFADGIRVWTGHGDDTISIDDTHDRRDRGVRTITFLNTGLGNDLVNVDLQAGEDDMLVLNTQGAYDQNVRDITLYGGDDVRPGDVVMGVTIGGVAVGEGRFSGIPGAGGTGNSVALFDSGRWTAAGWQPVSVTVLRTYVEVFEAAGASSVTLATALQAGDEITATVNGVTVEVSVSGQQLTFLAGPVTGLVMVSIARTTTETPNPGSSHATDTDDDTVHAETSTLPLVIIGGQGDDTLHGGLGGDIVLADRGRILWFEPGSVPVAGLGGEILTPAQLAALEAAATAVAGHGGPGDKTDGIERLVGLVVTVDPRIGGDDTVTTGRGNDTVMGGAGDDVISTSRDSATDVSDIVFGDHGFVDYVLLDGDPTDLDRVWSTEPTLGGADVIQTGIGDDIVVGGADADTIFGGAGRNIVLGDSGRFTAVPDETRRWGNLPMASGTLETVSPATGGADVIRTLEGIDIILGGADGDWIEAGAGDDVVVGDNGRVDWAVRADALRVVTVDVTDNGIGGQDTIYGQDGDDHIYGDTGSTA
jgi:hypothetical protein